jgi:uncharacterized protein
MLRAGGFDMELRSGFAKFLLTLAIIGAINWGLIGLFNWNLVDAIFGGGTREVTSGFSRVIYTLVGLGGALALIPLFSDRTRTTSERRSSVGRPVTT